MMSLSATRELVMLLQPSCGRLTSLISVGSEASYSNS